MNLNLTADQVDILVDAVEQVSGDLGNEPFDAPIPLQGLKDHMNLSDQEFDHIINEADGILLTKEDDQIIWG